MAESADRVHGVEGLSQRAFEYVVGRGKESGRMPEDADPGDAMAVLGRLGLIDGDCPSIAAALLFHETPERFAAGACIRIGEFTADGIPMRDDCVCGPAICQPERALELLCGKYIPGIHVHGGTSGRPFFRYPRDALREAVLNAVQHKDYSMPHPISIRIYPDRIRISNAGDLPAGWDREMLAGLHVSMPRNPKIAAAFRAAGLADNWGLGIGKMLNACKEAKYPKPRFEMRSEAHEFAVVFEAKEVPQPSESVLEPALHAEMSGTQKSIVELMRGNPRMTTSSMAESLGVSQRAVKSNIAKLKEAGLVLREGSARSGSWIVIGDL